jgi:hypothetical protein
MSLPSPTSARERDWALLLAACRFGAPDLAERVDERFGKAAAAEWSGFLRLMDEQGTGPLAASALLDLDEQLLPAQVRSSLAERVRLANLRAGVLVGELLEIVDAFEQRGIEVVAHKGPALSLLAYGRVGARDSVDLDLVVRESDVDAAERLLRERGYRRSLPGDLSPRADRAWRRVGNEIEFVGDWIFVDLHWRLFPTWLPFRLEPGPLWPLAQRVSLAGGTLRTWSREVQLVAHCLHGAKDRWRKMLWLCDVDRLVRGIPAPSWDTVVALGEAARGRRALGLGLLLAHRLLGTPLPPEVAACVERDPGTTRLVEEVARRLPRGPVARPWWMASPDVWPFHVRVFDTRLDGLSYLGRCVLTPVPWGWEVAHIPLPDVLYPLYYVLKPARMAGGMTRKGMQRLSAALRGVARRRR